ncbi:hypothetical protein [Bordetella genomosp. 8]|uniref:hypothetical protein n=1 Tax=Bordetella genomosp. 8 TaxID=1416806 RepID=UPI0012FD6AF7|nr:hypothetical protein [Bordetella genomosp. 8]
MLGLLIRSPEKGPAAYRMPGPAQLARPKKVVHNLVSSPTAQTKAGKNSRNEQFYRCTQALILQDFG